MKLNTKKTLYIIAEIALFCLCINLLYFTYDIYFGDALYGSGGGGLAFVFFGWIPGVIGLITVPIQILLVLSIFEVI